MAVTVRVGKIFFRRVVGRGTAKTKVIKEKDRKTGRRARKLVCVARDADREVDEKNKNEVGWFMMLILAVMNVNIGRWGSVFFWTYQTRRRMARRMG